MMKNTQNAVRMILGTVLLFLAIGPILNTQTPAIDEEEKQQVIQLIAQFNKRLDETKEIKKVPVSLNPFGFWVIRENNELKIANIGLAGN